MGKFTLLVQLLAIMSLAASNCYATTVDELRQLASTNSHISELYSIGQTLHNDQLVLQINSNYGDGRQCLQPMVKFVANSRGTDAKSEQLLIDFADHLLSGYNKGDEQIVNLIDNYDIHIMPSMNPDEKAGKIADLRNDFPFWNNQQLNNEELLAERSPLTQALMKWIMENPFILSVNVDHLADETEDNGAMSNFHHYFSNGEEVQLNIKDELSRKEIWESNKDSLLNQFKKLSTGIKGHVLDKNYGFGSNVRVMIENDEKPIFTTPGCGEFWKSLEPGTYKLTAWGTDKHKSRPIEIAVKEGQMTRIDFVLDQLDQSADENHDQLKSFPNPEIYQSVMARSPEACACFRATATPTTVDHNPIFICPPEPGKNRIVNRHTIEEGDEYLRLKSPEYPMEYPGGTYTCKYIIKNAVKTKRLLLTHLKGDFYLRGGNDDCTNDYVKISGLISGTDTLCGDDRYNSLAHISASNILELEFKVTMPTNASNEDRFDHVRPRFRFKIFQI